ncbi:MAG: LysR substrate-binding domain-containing protein [Steroidobacteraceae bacterium]
MDQLRAMRAFVRVGEFASFSRAADAIDSSRAMTSTLVAQLERHLGVRLLHRTTRRVSLTPEGAEYHDKCRRILAEIDAADASLKGARERPSGRLRVDVPHSFGRYLLLPALPAFTERYPDLALDVSLNDRYVDLEAEGVDVALRAGVSPQARLIARRVATSRLITCAAPQYLARFGAPRTPDDLHDHRLIGYKSGARQRASPWRFTTGQTVRRLKLGFRLTVDTAEAPIVAALEGVGIVQTVDLLVMRLLSEGRLIELLGEYSSAGAPLSVVYPRSNQNSVKVRVFADFAARLLSDWQKRVVVAGARG